MRIPENVKQAGIRTGDNFLIKLSTKNIVSKLNQAKMNQKTSRNTSVDQYGNYFCANLSEGWKWVRFCFALCNLLNREIAIQT